MAETKAQQLHREWTEAQDGLNPGETDLSRTLDNLATVRAGWFRVRGRYVNPAPGDSEFGFLVLPDVPVYPQGSKEARAAEDAWEAKSIAMHAAQRTLTLTPKPQTNALAERVVRAD